MFKYAKSEDEIFNLMNKNLINNQVEKTHGFSRIAKATDYLNSAAVAFEKAGMMEEASEITKILEDLTKELNKF